MLPPIIVAPLVGLLVALSVAAAALPALAASRAGNGGRALRLTPLSMLPLISGAIYLLLAAQSGFGSAAAWSALASTAVLLACSFVVYHHTPEVDRFDRLVLGLLNAFLLAPLSIVALGIYSLLASVGTSELALAVLVVALILGLPALVVVSFNAVLRRTRPAVPPPPGRIESGQRRMAEATARELLQDVMGEETTKQASTRGYLEVDGKLCRYRVYPGSFRTAVLNKNGRWIGNLCVIPTNSQPIPDYDQLLAKVLMLQHAEEEFWLMANLIDSGPEAWEIRDRLTGEAPLHRRDRVEPADACP
ncbi:MAG: hypothetical protein GEU28_02710 [Dehalococcoidia bacterium]|nr:hypothetical protein [Dehalococcoidia bacterium]